MSGHTPGPWVAHPSKYEDGRYLVQTEHPSRRVLAMFDGDGDGFDPTDIANARLIAAAPDLLEALKGFNITEANIVAGTGDALVVRVPLSAIQAAAAAVAKAEGRS